MSIVNESLVNFSFFFENFKFSRDIINDLRRLNLISQSLTDLYTINQCQELKQSSPEMQTNFIFYMIIKLLRNEGYIDDNLLRKLSTDIHEKNIEEISRKILTNGCLTVEQIVQSIRAFFFQDVKKTTQIQKRKISSHPIYVSSISMKRFFVINWLNQSPLLSKR